MTSSRMWTTRRVGCLAARLACALLLAVPAVTYAAESCTPPAKAEPARYSMDSVAAPLQDEHDAGHVQTVKETEQRTPLSNVVFDVPEPSPGVPVESPAAATKPAPTAARVKHTGRALLEMGTFVVGSAANYWRKYASFVEDWQFPLTWAGQRRKWFTNEGIRLDSNNMRLNWTHGWAGAVYYSYSRSNGRSALGSYLFSAGGSLFWEYIAEWREISSINDHIFTAIGGPAIAEPLFQLSSYYRSRPGLVNRVAEAITNPIVALNDLLDGRNRPSRDPVDVWKDFRFAVGGLNGALTDDGSKGTQTALALDLHVVTLPNYGKAGTGTGYSRGTVDAAFGAYLNRNGSANEEFGVNTRATLFGWWRKNVRVDDQQRRHGYDLWFGAQTAWDIFQKTPIAPYDGHDLGFTRLWFPRPQPTQYTDKISSVHFPGPTFSITSYAGRLRSRLDLGADINFSMVNSLSYNDYSASHDTYGVQTALHNWGYYYAFGTTLTGRAEVEYGVLRATAAVDYRRFRSIQHNDRYQSLLTDDAPLHDSRFVSSASLTAQIPRVPVFSTVTIEHIDRSGLFHEISRRTSETRVSYVLGVTF